MIKAVLTDIEGTTSSISFVHDVLFPYAAKHMARFVRENHSLAEVSQQLDDVANVAGLDRQDIVALTEQLLAWMREDKKITPLKALQGLIWADGYSRADFSGHVYDDVPACLERWKREGIGLYVYSSGSVRAQKLLFSHTEFGDLTGLFDGYFDTQVGGKKEVSSYLAIAKSIAVPASEILFLSDIEEELDAANEAGMQTRWLVREGQTPAQSKFTVVRDFSQL
jgi:enolase-phosphatase E1